MNWYAPYRLILPGALLGWIFGGMIAPLVVGIFAENMLRIHDAALWLPPILFFPFGLVGLMCGGIAGILVVRIVVSDDR